jgi:anti-sigma B factor antagonist
MPNNAPTLLVAVVDNAAIIKVTGRANFTTSVSFKRLFGELRERGFKSFILDLSDCVTMDSTFLGVLAGTALKLSDRTDHNEAIGAHHPGVPAHALRLLNPNQRIIELLDNLGVSDLFRSIHCQAPAAPSEFSAPAEEDAASREEVSRTCLEAHELLMELNPANIPKFKDVAQFLAEDLHKMSAPGEPAAQGVT